jgi:Tfp pilus assembly protein PilE
MERGIAMSRRLKYFITYFTLMITILAIITVSVYNSFVMEMRKELMGTNLATLTQVQDVFERFIGDIQKTTLQMEKRLELICILTDRLLYTYKSICSCRTMP